MNIRFNQV